MAGGIPFSAQLPLSSLGLWAVVVVKATRQLNMGGALMTKCVICDKRPANNGGYCAPCGNYIESMRKARANNQPRHFLTYRGHVVGLYPVGEGRLKPRLLKRSAEHLPKRKTLDLNVYCDGFTREKTSSRLC